MFTTPSPVISGVITGVGDGFCVFVGVGFVVLVGLGEALPEPSGHGTVPVKAEQSNQSILVYKSKITSFGGICADRFVRKEPRIKAFSAGICESDMKLWSCPPSCEKPI
jgi:hypothetical protein